MIPKRLSFAEMKAKQEALAREYPPTVPQTPGATAPATPQTEYGWVEVNKIVPDLNQPRQSFDEEELARLAESISKRGMLQPVRLRPEGAHFALVTGELRWRAAIKAGLDKIPALFVQRPLVPEEWLAEQIVEQLLRQDHKPIEQAHGFKRYMALKGLGVREAALALHLPPNRISRALALLEQPPEVQELVRVGELAPSVAEVIAKLPEEERVETARHAARKKLSRAQVAEEVKGRRGIQRTITTFTVKDGEVLVKFCRDASAHDVVAALESALEQAQQQIPKLRIAG